MYRPQRYLRRGPGEGSPPYRLDGTVTPVYMYRLDGTVIGFADVTGGRGCVYAHTRAGAGAGVCAHARR